MPERPIHTPPHLELIQIPRPHQAEAVAEATSVLEQLGVPKDLAGAALAVAGAVAEDVASGKPLTLGTVIGALGGLLRGQR